MLLDLFLFFYVFPPDAGFGATGGFGASAFGTANNSGGLFGATQNKPGMLFLIYAVFEYEYISGISQMSIVFILFSLE